MKITKILAACALLVPCASSIAAPQPYRMDPPARWVDVAQDLPLEGVAPVEQGESDYLLVDHQVRLADVTAHYTRYVERLVSQAAVDDGAQISIDIDPEHEKLLLHDVRVLRDGRAIDKLADSRRSLLNREEGLDQGLINGRVTLHVLLQDVRVGDVLDYSFTLERREPISERAYNEWFSTQWGTPVRRFRLRVLRPEDRPLLVRDHGKLPAPREARRGGWLETTWDARDIAPLASEESRPSWFFHYPRIELSEHADWNAVRAWALPMYEIARGQKDALAALLAEIRTLPEEEARILKALRFVQDDVRYTGLEIGAGAWRPTQPATVLQRRFGDCKDKTLLFVALMRALGHEAWPALVHSDIGRGTAERAPSPGAFDHVIAKLRYAGRDYWLDATASGQGGTLDTVVQADYGLALVLAPGADGLETIPHHDAGAPSQFVVETFDFRKGTAKPAAFTVLTHYRNDEADSMRVNMRTNTASKLGKEYLDYYRKSYSSIRSTKPLVVKDDRERNQLTIEESYEIDTPFEKNDEGEREFSLEAYLITDRTGTPKQTVRTTPLARSFPMHVRHEIVAYLPGEWNIEGEGLKIRNAAFEYDSSVRFRNGKLELAYDLRNTADHVQPAAMKAFVAELDKAHDDAYYTLTDGEEPAQAAASTPAKPREGPSVDFALGIVTGAGLGIWLAYVLWTTNPPLRAASAAAPAGLGGWLILLAVGLAATPLALGSALYVWTLAIGSHQGFTSFGTGAQYVLLALTIALSMALVLSFVVPVLFLRRRSSFPRGYIAGQLLLVAVAVSGCIAGLQADTLTPAAAMRQVSAAVLGVGSAALWIAYVLTSQRVRATFVFRADGTRDEPPALAPANANALPA